MYEVLLISTIEGKPLGVVRQNANSNKAVYSAAKIFASYEVAYGPCKKEVVATAPDLLSADSELTRIKTKHKLQKVPRPPPLGKLHGYKYTVTVVKPKVARFPINRRTFKVYPGYNGPVQWSQINGLFTAVPINTPND